MEEEFEYLSKLSNEITITIPAKDFEFMKLLYHYIPHDKSSFSNFVLLAAKRGLAPVLWEAPDYVQARLFLLLLDKDPYVDRAELERETGLPNAKPPRFPLKDWKSPRIWHMDWYSQFGSWYGFTPRWKR